MLCIDPTELVNTDFKSGYRLKYAYTEDALYKGLFRAVLSLG